jgi:hypothetical protein
MDREIELLSQQLRECVGANHRIAELLLEQEFDDGVGQLVSVPGTGTLGDQARQAAAVVQRLGLIEHGTGDPERRGDYGDGSALDVSAAEHLVPDLHEVARVEELAALEQGISHLLGTGVEDALLPQGFAFGVQGLGHGASITSRSPCQSNYAAIMRRVKDLLSET